ncbi:MAG: hypothetical protein AMXMBFR13_42760 [Phycisphaerae bacterium]
MIRQTNDLMGYAGGLFCGGLLAAVGCASDRPCCRTAEQDCTQPHAVAAPSTAPSTGSVLAANPGEWVELFDGRTLTGWKVLTEKAFDDHGPVYVENGTIILGTGNRETGIRCTRDFPRDDYEISLEGMRVDGYDFFCGMTFPVGEEPCTLILGGWGGSVVGLSNVDGAHAAENETTEGYNFENGRWYEIRLRVTPDRIGAWINDDQVVNLERAGRTFSVWWEQEPCRPFGISSWETKAALRNIKVRRIPGP